MKFISRILILFIILSNESYGEPEPALPEKIMDTIVEKIIDLTSTQKESDEVLQKVSDKPTQEDDEVEKKSLDNVNIESTKIGEQNTEDESKLDNKKEIGNKNEVDDKKEISDSALKRTLPEISLGSKKAPVTMINYSSLSCGHCAHFNTDTLPEIEEKYINPGYLRIIFRDYPGDQVSLKAHQLAWCKGEIKYLDIIKILYENQDKWLLDPEPLVALKAIALQNGITDKQYESCFKNQELLDQIISVRLEGQKKYNITATPTIIINAKIYQKALSLEEIEDIMKVLMTPLEKAEKN